MFWENIMAMWLVSSFSSTEFPLIGPGGWQHPHLCPDAFKTLAGRGRPITEGGQSSSAFSVGRAVRDGEVAPATTLAHLGEQQRLSRPEGCLWQHCSCTSFKGMLVLKLCPRGDPAYVGCQMSLCWRKGGRWFESAAPFQGAALRLGQGFHPELLPPWATGNAFQGIESWGWEGARGWAVRGRTARLSRRGLVRMSLEALSGASFTGGCPQGPPTLCRCWGVRQPGLSGHVAGTRGPQTSHTALLRRRWGQSTTA